MDTIFYYCKEIPISPSNPVAVEEIVALPVSAVCITPTVDSAHGADAPETVAVEVSAGPKPRDELTAWVLHFEESVVYHYGNYSGDALDNCRERIPTSSKVESCRSGIESTKTIIAKGEFKPMTDHG